MVAGGVAAAVYGEPRLTLDIDIVARLKPGGVASFVNQFREEEFYCPPAEVIDQEVSRSAFGHFNLLHRESDARADVYLAGEDPFVQRGLAARRVVVIAGLVVPISPPEYVILHKLRFRKEGASERHLRDVRAMLRVLGDSIDAGQLERDASEMGLAEQWHELRALSD